MRRRAFLTGIGATAATLALPLPALSAVQTQTQWIPHAPKTFGRWALVFQPNTPNVWKHMAVRHVVPGSLFFPLHDNETDSATLESVTKTRPMVLMLSNPKAASEPIPVDQVFPPLLPLMPLSLSPSGDNVLHFVRETDFVEYFSCHCESHASEHMA